MSAEFDQRIGHYSLKGHPARLTIRSIRNSSSTVALVLCALAAIAVAASVLAADLSEHTLFTVMIGICISGVFASLAFARMARSFL
jgi:hypothetical protein